MRTKITPSILAQIDAWYAIWRIKRKTMAAKLRISESTLMNVAKRETPNYGIRRRG